MAQGPPPRDPIAAAAARARVPEWLLRRLVSAESGGNQGAVSSAGARGAAQLMPGTAAGLEKKYGIDTSSIEGNILGGAYYLREQLDRFKRPDLALSAYNSGPGGSESSGRVENFAETQAYVKKILGGQTGAVSGGVAAARPTPAATTSPEPDLRRQLAMALIQQRRGGQRDPQALVSLVARMRGNAAPGSPPASSPVAGAATPAPEPHDAHGDPGGFVPEFKTRLAAMVAASGGRLKITSGYRSPERQAQLYAAALKKYGSEQAARKWVAPPGKSKHGEGVAADLGGDLDWAHKNAARFGLYFPMSWEPWHVEIRGSR